MRRNRTHKLKELQLSAARKTIAIAISGVEQRLLVKRENGERVHLVLLGLNDR
jgi:hypothetical protein